MLPRNPNIIHTSNLTDSVRQGKPQPTKSKLSGPTRLSRPEAERLLALADFLPLSDAALLREVLDRGRSLAHIARLQGLPRHRIRTRITRLIARINDPTFAFVALQRLGPISQRSLRTRSLAAAPRWPEEWSESLRIVAQLCVLDGCSCRDAAIRSGISGHTLRRQLTTLRELGRIWRSNALLREAS